MNVDYAALYKAAIETTTADRSVLPAGSYLVKVAKVVPGSAKSGKYSIGIMLAVLEGERKGSTTWINQYLTAQEDNATAFQIFLEHVVPFTTPEFRSSNKAPNLIHEGIEIGTVGTAVLAIDGFGGVDRNKLVRFTQGTAAVAAVAQKPAAAPVAVAVPVPVAAPVAVVEVAAPAVDLQAQLAALQAQLAAQAPVVEAPEGEEPF